MANKTLQFYGYAYGAVPVQLNAHVNGEVVFSGTVPTTNQPLPVGDTPDMTDAPVLFTLENSTLFPVEFSGTVPMTISIATGDGVALGDIDSNYMSSYTLVNQCELANSSITGNVLTIGEIVSGTPGVDQTIWPTPFVYGDWTTEIVSGSGLVYEVDPPQTVANCTMIGSIFQWFGGRANVFAGCFNGLPGPTDPLTDPRSNVTIDGVVQNPPRDSETGTWTYIVPQGSTIAYDLNISIGQVGNIT